MAQIRFDRTVLAALDPVMVARGADYHAGGKVLDLRVEDDGMALLAAIRGTDPVPYEVDVTVLERRGGGYEVDGFCTCPVEFNCKHVAAALHAALHGGAPPTAGAGGSPPTARAAIPPTPASLLSDWLAGVERAAAQGAEADRPAPVPDHVRFLLQPPGYPGGTPRLEAVVARPRRQGGLSQVRTVTLAALAQSTARGVTDGDRLLARLALGAGRHGQWSDDGLPEDPALAEEILARLLGTGRLHWQSLDGAVLRPGGALPATLVWDTDGHGRQSPRLEPQGGGTGAVVLSAIPPRYVDPGNALLGPLELPASGALVRSLLAAPPLDPVAATVAAERLAGLLPAATGAATAAATGVVIGAAGGGRSPITLPRCTVRVETDARPPVIRLHLATHEPPRERSGWWGYPAGPQDNAWLSFDYDGLLVSPSDRADEFRRADGDGVVVRVRRRDEEGRAVERLAAAGLRPSYPLHWLDVRTTPPGVPFGQVGAPAKAWLSFMARTVPALKAEGWRVEVADGFRWRLAEVTGWDGEATPAGAGWFDLDMGVLVDGGRIPLLPLLLPLLRGSADPEALLAHDPEAVLTAPLPDGRHVALPLARVAPLARVLFDLFAGTRSLDAAGRARIDLGGAALLDRQGELPLPPLLAPEQRDRLRRLLEPAEEAADPPGLVTPLRPYQRRGLGWLLALEGAGVGGLLADDMGLGKTLQVIAFMQALKAAGRLETPALVLAPTSVAPNWLREAARHAPGLRAHLHQGPDRAQRWPDPAAVDLVVTSYPLLLRDQALLAGLDWSLLVLDEAQAVKNQAAKSAELVRTLRAGRRLCVTGTPLENHLGELWAQMDVVMPGLLGDSRSFTRLFRTPIEKKADGARQRLLASRLKPFILRRTKAEVAAELPPKTEILERIPLADGQRDLYETLRLAMDAKVREAIAARGLGRSHIVILEALLRLRQACCDPRLLPAEAEAAGKAARRRAAGMAASAKRARLMQMLPDMVAEGRRILLFSQFTGMLDLIRADLDAAGLRHVSLTGTTRDRMAPVEAFQSGAADIFLISLKAGGTGLTLTAADTVVHYDPWWNPAVEDQATDRAHRIGQDKPVFVYKLVAEGTVEDRMLDMQARKRALAAAIHDAGPDSPGSLTEADIDALFAPIRG